MKVTCENVFRDDSEIDLIRASLNISQYVRYPELDIEHYISKLTVISDEIASRIPDSAGTRERIEIINGYLYNEMGFCGNRSDYYDPRNSFLNDVIDHRKGIPISMSILYSHIAQKAGIDLKGVCFPGHFMLRSAGYDREIIVDPYNEGKILSRDDCQSVLDNLFGGKVKLEERFLEFADNSQILKRVVNNLKSIYVSGKDYEKALKTVNLLLSLDPDDVDQLRDRALICINLECYSQSLEDLQSYFSKTGPDVNDDELKSYIPLLRNIVGNLN